MPVIYIRITIVKLVCFVFLRITNLNFQQFELRFSKLCLDIKVRRLYKKQKERWVDPAGVLKSGPSPVRLQHSHRIKIYFNKNLSFYCMSNRRERNLILKADFHANINWKYLNLVPLFHVKVNIHSFLMHFAIMVFFDADTNRVLPPYVHCR